MDQATTLSSKFGTHVLTDLMHSTMMMHVVYSQKLVECLLLAVQLIMLKYMVMVVPLDLIPYLLLVQL